MTDSNNVPENVNVQASDVQNQNNNISDQIQTRETANLTAYQTAQYQNVQIAYLDSNIYVLKFFYFGLVILLSLLTVANAAKEYGETEAFPFTKIAPCLFLVAYPYTILFLEFSAYSCIRYIFAAMTGNVYIPIDTKASSGMVLQ